MEARNKLQRLSGYCNKIIVVAGILYHVGKIRTREVGEDCRTNSVGGISQVEINITTSSGYWEVKLLTNHKECIIQG